MKPLRTLRQCLIDTALPHLRVIARLWGLEVQASRPLEVAAELAQGLADPVRVVEMWNALPHEGRAALTALLQAGGLMPEASFFRRFGEIRPMGPGRLEREAPWRNPIGPAEVLWYRGLIFGGFAGEGGETYPVFFVPAELQASIPVQEEPETIAIHLDPVAPPARSSVSGDFLLDDLSTVLAFVHNETVRPPVRSPIEWPEKSRRALVRCLRDPDAERFHFMLHLIHRLGWTRISDSGRLRLVAEPVMAWLKEKEEKSREVLVDAWRRVTGWDELWRLTSLQTDDTETWHNDPTLARAALLRYLNALSPDEWVQVQDFIRAIKASDPDFQRPGGDYETWYIRDRATGEYLSGFESWDRVEGVLLRALLTGPVWWLGLVELGSTEESDLPDMFRPRATTRLVPIAETPPALVHPDLTVTISAARRFERFQLARVADLARVDDLYIYRLTPGSLQRARQQRIDPEKVLGFLDDLSDAPLPKTAPLSLTRWAEHGTEIWLERAVLMRVSDEAVMQQIISSPGTSRYIGRVVGSTGAVVAESDWSSLLAALAELGLLAELVGIQDR